MSKLVPALRKISRRAIPLGAVLFSPPSGWILSLGDMVGMRAWQNLFLLEGLPFVVLGVVGELAARGSNTP